MDGSPVAVTDWYQPGINTVQRLSKTMFGSSDVKFVLPNTFQPTSDRSTKCVAMVIESASMSTNWIKIPCGYPYARQSHICKIKANTTSANSTQKRHQASENVIFGCKKGYTKIGQRCILLWTSTNNIDERLSCIGANDACRELGGYISIVSNTFFETIKQYLKIWRHEVDYGDIYVGSESTNATHSECKVIYGKITNVDCQVASWNVENPTKISNPLNVLCESGLVSLKQTCQEHQHQCSDGSCILRHHVCDGSHDCKDEGDEANCTCDAHTFRCDNGVCIPIAKYCDFHTDCPDASDEKSCFWPNCTDGQFQCSSGQCINESLRCDFVQDCIGAPSDELNCEDETCKGFQCYTGQCIPPTQQYDLVVDCPGPSQEDEHVPTQLLTKRGFWYEMDLPRDNMEWSSRTNYAPYCTDSHGDKARCHLGRITCFPRQDACVYDHDVYGSMTGCRDGAHLRHCKDFQCPGQFKCPHSYCIPHRKLCDGVRDCWDGEDETGCAQYGCPGRFKCKDESFCIDQSEVCDGVVHCKTHQDDEKLCNLPPCPHGCVCKGHSIACHNSTLEAIPVISKLTRGLSFPHNVLNMTVTSFSGFVWLGRLNIASNRLEDIPIEAFRDLENLYELDLRYNYITILRQHMFMGLSNLKTLMLFGNPIYTLSHLAMDGLNRIKYLNFSGLGISQIRDNAFAFTNRLSYVDLSNNRLSRLTHATFTGLETLRELSIEHNSINEVDDGTFDELGLEVLKTDGFKFCCFAKKIQGLKCTPEGDEFSSCEDLMAEPILQGTIWLLGFVACIGNALVISWRCKYDRQKTPSIIIIHLGISDLLMGVYLILIASVDQFYRGRYILYADSWRSSGLCKFAGFISMLSSEMSVYCLLLITVDRLISIVLTLRVRRISRGMVTGLLLAGWTVFATLSALPISGSSYFGSDYIKNGVCILFNFTQGKQPGWEYAASIFLGFNITAFVFIFFGYIIIYSSIRKTQRQSGRKADPEATLARQFILVVLSDFLCWVPMILVSIMALTGHVITPQVAAWMVVFVMPINSALNPVLYTLSAYTLSRRRQRRRATMVKSMMTSADYSRTTTVRENSREIAIISSSAKKTAPHGKSDEVKNNDPCDTKL